MKKIKYLLLLIPFLFISNVKADIVQYKFFGYESTSGTTKQTYFNPDEGNTYIRDFVLFNGSERFFAFSYCSDGFLDYWFPDNFEGSTSLVGYSTGGSCNVQGYDGTNYIVYFMAKQVNDAGNGNLSIMFNTYVKNNTGHKVLINVLGLTSVNSIPAGVKIPTYDGEFSTLNTKIDTVEQAVQEVKKAQNENLNEQKKTNDTLKDDNIQQAQDSAGGFFNDFTTDTHGLTGIITAPLSLIESITSSSCSPLVIPLPFVNKDLTLPCMGAIYSQYFGSFLSIYQIITFGIVAYWVLVRIFNLVKDFKNPDHDEIEVLDL